MQVVRSYMTNPILLDALLQCQAGTLDSLSPAGFKECLLGQNNLTRNWKVKRFVETSKITGTV